MIQPGGVRSPGGTSVPREVHLFDAPDYAPDWTPARIDDRYRPCFAHCDDGTLRGEATPIYLFLPAIAGELKRYNPGAILTVASATAAGCRNSTTKRAPGKSACRNRVRTRLGGDFSISQGLSRSQCGRHSRNSRAAAARVVLGRPGVAEPRDVGVVAQAPEQGRRPAAVESGDEDVAVLHDGARTCP